MNARQRFQYLWTNPWITGNSFTHANHNNQDYHGSASANESNDEDDNEYS